MKKIMMTKKTVEITVKWKQTWNRIRSCGLWVEYFCTSLSERKMKHIHKPLLDGDQWGFVKIKIIIILFFKF